MTDEIVLEDIFEIGERLLAEGADPGAVVCLRGVLEHFHERYGFFPFIRTVDAEGEFRLIELTWKIENYYWKEMNIKGTTPYHQITGWSTYKGKVDKKEDGEVYYEAGESWYSDLEEYIERNTRRHYRRGVVGSP